MRSQYIVGIALIVAHLTVAAEQERPRPEVYSRIPITLAVPIAKIKEVARSVIDQEYRTVTVPKFDTPLGTVYGSAGWQALPQRFDLSVNDSGALSISLPVTLKPNLKTSALFEIDIGFTKIKPKSLFVIGCGKINATIRISVVPTIKAGRIKFTADQRNLRATLPKGYKCSVEAWLLAKVRDEDITGRIESELRKNAWNALSDLLPNINQSIGMDDLARRLTSQHLQLIDNMTLGMHFRDYQIKQIRGTAENELELVATLSGVPWVAFGAGITTPPHALPKEGRDGFILPVGFVFPTSDDLRPMPEESNPTEFRLVPTESHTEMAVLRRGRGEATRDIVWLSGRLDDVPGTETSFNEPMTGVLDEILLWLNDPNHWQDSNAVPELRDEVARVRGAIAYFQQPRQFRIDDMATLELKDLKVDLNSVSVRAGQLRAAVSLTGKALVSVRVN